jgi:putative RNA 2'-phosphotransferase
MNDTKVSKFLSLVLRHKPSAANLKLDDNGWADVPLLIKQTSFVLFNDVTTFTLADLERIVKEDSKGRYSFSANKDKIRANQGHSISVDVELKEAEPPEILYHGTSVKFLTPIFKDGIKKMSRQHVHLSSDKETAVKVGSRHGSPVVLEIKTKPIFGGERKFFLSENGVWLIDHIKPREICFRGYYEFNAIISFPENQTIIPVTSYSTSIDLAEEEAKELVSERNTHGRPVKLDLISVTQAFSKGK